jgi:undecaprenyl-diphosphatase
LDTELFFRIYGDGHGLIASAMIALSAVGSGWSMLGLPPFLAVRRTRLLAGSLTLALALTAIGVFMIKIAVGRVRPCVTLPGVHAHFFAAPTDGSFPSGHAAGSFCFAAYCIVLVARSGWSTRARIAVSAMLGALAAGIAISRVYLGVHYPFDVGAGALLGSAVGAAFGLRTRAGSIQTPPS